MKNLAEGPNYCRMPTQFNPNEHECADRFTIIQALYALLTPSLLPICGIVLLEWLSEKHPHNRSWNPMTGAFWGVAYILITIINALTLGHSDSSPMTLQFFQLLLTVPRLTWVELIGHTGGALRGGEENKKAAADAVVMETTIGTVSLGFMIDLYLRMTACDGMSILVKTSAFLLPALGLVSSLSGLAATGLQMARNEVKERWALPLLPLLAVSVATPISSLVFWSRFLAISPHLDCENGLDIAPAVALQLFLPLILGLFRILTRGLPILLHSYFGSR